MTWKHLFLGALVPIVTMSGIQLGYLLGGTVVVEEIFVLPGSRAPPHHRRSTTGTSRSYRA